MISPPVVRPLALASADLLPGATGNGNGLKKSGADFVRFVKKKLSPKGKGEGRKGKGRQKGNYDSILIADEWPSLALVFRCFHCF